MDKIKLYKEENNGNNPIRRKPKKRKIKDNSQKTEQEQKRDNIFFKINAEDFPEIHNLKSKLDICLYLLKILREKEQ